MWFVQIKEDEKFIGYVYEVIATENFNRKNMHDLYRVYFTNELTIKAATLLLSEYYFSKENDNEMSEALLYIKDILDKYFTHYFPSKDEGWITDSFIIDFKNATDEKTCK